MNLNSLNNKGIDGFVYPFFLYYFCKKNNLAVSAIVCLVERSRDLF